mmetsp:Transcript_88160/g.175014  ORF Transcript_88160/g.175014 Transcript_88160/m.175014 type:complete len:476 (-) Transcript_88160:32-1459(-)
MSVQKLSVPCVHDVHRAWLMRAGYELPAQVASIDGGVPHDQLVDGLAAIPHLDGSLSVGVQAPLRRAVQQIEAAWLVGTIQHIPRASDTIALHEHRLLVGCAQERLMSHILDEHPPRADHLSLAASRSKRHLDLLIVAIDGYGLACHCRAARHLQQDQPCGPSDVSTLNALEAWMVCHCIAGYELARIILGRRPRRWKRPGIWSPLVFDAPRISARRVPAPMPSLLVQVPEQVHANPGPLDVGQQRLRVAPTATGGAEAVHDACRWPMGQEHIHAHRDLAEAVGFAPLGPREGLKELPALGPVVDTVRALARIPGAPCCTPDAKAIDDHLLVVQHETIGGQATGRRTGEQRAVVARCHRLLCGQLTLGHSMASVIPIMVTRNHDDGPEAGREVLEPLSEARQLFRSAVVREVAGVAQYVGVWEGEALFNGPMHVVRVAHVQDLELCVAGLSQLDRRLVHGLAPGADWMRTNQAVL